MLNLVLHCTLCVAGAPYSIDEFRTDGSVARCSLESHCSFSANWPMTSAPEVKRLLRAPQETDARASETDLALALSSIVDALQAEARALPVDAKGGSGFADDKASPATIGVVPSRQELLRSLIQAKLNGSSLEASLLKELEDELQRPCNQTMRDDRFAAVLVATATWEVSTLKTARILWVIQRRLRCGWDASGLGEDVRAKLTPAEYGLCPKCHLPSDVACVALCRQRVAAHVARCHGAAHALPRRENGGNSCSL